MFKKVLFLALSLSLLLLGGCASKRYTKKGAQFEAAGYYDQAAAMYYRAVIKNPKNVDAAIGLRKAGQITLEQKLTKFKDLYNGNDIKGAVYAFMEADRFYAQLSGVKCALDFPVENRDFYAEVKKIYLEQLYQKALALMTDEQFAQAEEVLHEMTQIEPDYLDVAELKKTAHYEPIYREGKEYLLHNKNRKAYYRFDEIVRVYPDYKDALDLKEEALTKALFTIAILEVENKTPYKNMDEAIVAEIQKQITENKSPFVKLISLDKTKEIKQEQFRVLAGQSAEDVNLEAGKVLGAKAFLSISLVAYRAQVGKLQAEKKPAYLKKEVPQKEEDAEPKYSYHKVEYTEYTRSETVYCKLSYELISVETGEVLLSDVISKEERDEIHYARYDGKTSQLVAGYWKDIHKKSPEDVVYDTKSQNLMLQGLFGARSSLTSVEALKKSIHQAVAKQLTVKIVSYDPEKD